jgi:hypothetical protein
MDADIRMANRMPGLEVGAGDCRDAEFSDDDGGRRNRAAQRRE